MIDPTLTIPAFKALQSALNLAIRLLPEARQELADQQGKIIELKCLSPDIALYIELGETCRLLHHSDSVNVGLEGSLEDWIAFVRASDRASELINGNLKLSGDSKWLMQLGDTIGKLDLDWEDELAKVIGDVPAHVIGSGGRQFMQTVLPIMDNVRAPTRELLDTALQSVSEFMDKNNTPNNKQGGA